MSDEIKKANFDHLNTTLQTDAKLATGDGDRVGLKGFGHFFGNEVTTASLLLNQGEGVNLSLSRQEFLEGVHGLGLSEQEREKIQPIMSLANEKQWTKELIQNMIDLEKDIFPEEEQKDN